MCSCSTLSAPTEQQYFDIDKRLAESQEQILSATRDLQTLKEENKKLSEFSHINTRYWGVSATSQQLPPLKLYFQTYLKHAS